MARHRWWVSGRLTPFRWQISASLEPASTSSASTTRQDCRTSHGTWTTSGSNRNRYSDPKSLEPQRACHSFRRVAGFFLAGSSMAGLIVKRIGLVLGFQHLVSGHVAHALSASAIATTLSL